MKIQIKCKNFACREGVIKDPFNKTETVCPDCHGTGKSTLAVGAIAVVELNLGDHGETTYTNVELDPEMTIQQLVEKVFNPEDYVYKDIRSIIFTKSVSLL